ncbi:hypothetical protein GGH93_002646 [Coemansia aciculifera]|nr:hypothetical protein GGH93_002646 [Coemansia aciculifera]
MDEDSSSSFFSFATPDPAPARDAPVIDDFLSAHVQNHSTAPVQELASASIVAVDSSRNIVAPSQTKITMPKPAARAVVVADEQIHPLIRSRRLDTPEEIAAWIAERKAKYPTAANTRAKVDQTASALATTSAHANGKRKHPVTEKISTANTASAASTNPLNMLMQYAGESESSESDADDDGPEVVSTKPPATRAPFKPSGLAPGEDRRKLQVCKYFAKGSCHKGNACPFSHPDSLNKPRKNTAPNSATEPKPAKGGPSLLEMLMAKDIDRENYRIFQCIEYICDKNFLGAPAHIELLYQARH